MAISRFESCDLTTIIDLKSILEQTQLTHRLLSQHLSLDPYQVNVARSVRLPLKLFLVYSARCQCDDEVSSVLWPNRCSCLFGASWRSNSKLLLQHFHAVIQAGARIVYWPDASWFSTSFYGSILVSVDPIQILKLNAWFVGILRVITRFLQTLWRQLMNFLDLIICLHWLTCWIQKILLRSLSRFTVFLRRRYPLDARFRSCVLTNEQVNYVFASYAKVMIDSMDPIKLPSLKYGVIGGYGYFDLKLKPIACYENLRSEFFQAIKEIVSPPGSPDTLLSFFYIGEHISIHSPAFFSTISVWRVGHECFIVFWEAWKFRG